MKIFKTIFAIAIAFKNTSYSLKVGQTQPVQYTFTLAGANNQKLKWTSTDETIASVDRLGVISTNRSGMATITADCYLGEVDLEVGTVTKIVKTGLPGIVAFACSLDGKLYAITNEESEAGGAFWAINKTSGEVTKVFDIGVPASYIQSMAFHYQTGKLYWAQCGSTSAFYEINPDSGVVKWIGQLGDSQEEITGLYFPYDQ